MIYEELPDVIKVKVTAIAKNEVDYIIKPNELSKEELISVVENQVREKVSAIERAKINEQDLMKTIG